MTGKTFIMLSALIFLIQFGCTQHKVEVAPVEIKPIHITVDVNVRIEKAVEDFYGDIYGTESN